MCFQTKKDGDNGRFAFQEWFILLDKAVVIEGYAPAILAWFSRGN